MSPTVALIGKMKDESHIIERWLAAVKNVCGDALVSYLIHDTGSTDNSIELVKQHMGDIPGEVREVPWLSFGENNTMLLQQGQDLADYLILVDCDIELEGHLDLEGVIGDALQCEIYASRTSWKLPLVTKTGIDWRYVGRCHEYLTSDEPFTYGVLPGIKFVHHSDGHSSGDPQRNMDLFMSQTTFTPRDMFYIGQTYGQLGDFDRSVMWYKQHVEVADIVEEKFVSLLRIALLEQSVEGLLSAWDFRPSRAEPLYEAIVILNSRQQYQTAWALAGLALQIPYPENDMLFVQDHIYQYDLYYQASIACDYIDRAHAIEMFEVLLERDDIPDYVRTSTQANLEFSRLHLNA